MLLVGDSLGRVILGYENEIRGLDGRHAPPHRRRDPRRPARPRHRDMPFLSYATPEDAVANAGRFLARGRGAGGQARGRRPQRPDRSRPLVRPGSRSWATSAGRPRRQTRPARSASRARTATRRRALLADALAVQEAGAFADRPRARARTARGGDHRAAADPDHRDRGGRRLQRPGPGRHRPARLRRRGMPRHARPYADLRGTIIEAAAGLRAPTSRPAPSPAAEQTVRMDEAVLDEVLGRGSSDRPAGVDPGRRASRSTATSERTARPAGRPA